MRCLDACLPFILAGALGCGERTPPSAPATVPPPSTPEPPARIPDVSLDTGFALRTSALRYALRHVPEGLAVEIPFTFVNDRDSAVHVPGCAAQPRGRVQAPPALEKERLPGKWVRAWTPATWRCAPATLIVPPGARVVDTLRVLAALSDDAAYPAFTVSPPEGVYRLFWLALRSYDPAAPDYGQLLPERWHQSNRFVLDPP